MVNVKMFRKIQQLKKRGYGKLAIGRKLNIDPATVRKYYNMKADEYHRYRLETLSRDKLFDSFKDEILSIYKSNNYQKLNMSGVYDYLEEKFKKLPGSEKSLEITYTSWKKPESLNTNQRKGSMQGLKNYLMVSRCSWILDSIN